MKGQKIMTKKTTAEQSAGIYKYTSKAKAISGLQRLDQRRMKIMTDIDGKQEGRIEINGIVFTLGCFNTAKYNDNAKALLEYLLTRFSEFLPFGRGATPETVFKTSTVTVTLDEFMVMRGLKDKKSARVQFRETAHTMLNVGMQFDYIIPRKKGRGKTKKIINEHARVDGYFFVTTIGIRTGDEDPLHNSRITFRINYDMIYYLCNRSIMPVDVRMFTIRPKENPHGFNIMRKLTEHYDMNAEKKNEEICISVRKLIEACPELPTVDEIRNDEAGQLSKRIREPFERDLDALEDKYRLIKCHYCKPGGIEFTDEEKQPAEYKFHEWLDLMIKFHLPDYPLETAKKLRRLREEEAQQVDTAIIPA